MNSYALLCEMSTSECHSSKKWEYKKGQVCPTVMYHLPFVENGAAENGFTLKLNPNSPSFCLKISNISKIESFPHGDTPWNTTAPVIVMEIPWQTARTDGLDSPLKVP